MTHSRVVESVMRVRCPSAEAASAVWSAAGLWTAHRSTAARTERSTALTATRCILSIYLSISLPYVSYLASSISLFVSTSPYLSLYLPLHLFVGRTSTGPRRGGLNPEQPRGRGHGLGQPPGRGRAPGEGRMSHVGGYNLLTGAAPSPTSTLWRPP